MGNHKMSNILITDDCRAKRMKIWDSQSQEVYIVAYQPLPWVILPLKASWSSAQ